MANIFGKDQEKIIYYFIKHKLGKIVISKQAQDKAWGIFNF